MLSWAALALIGGSNEYAEPSDLYAFRSSHGCRLRQLPFHRQHCAYHRQSLRHLLRGGHLRRRADLRWHDPSSFVRLYRILLHLGVQSRYRLSPGSDELLSQLCQRAMLPDVPCWQFQLSLWPKLLHLRQQPRLHRPLYAVTERISNWTTVDSLSARARGEFG
jgi:hypothetical protein